jgi:hypothetical protein
MNCEEFKDAIVMRIYGELPADLEDALQEHVRECSGCARIYARTLGLKNVLGVDDDIPAPDWEASWRVIRERSQKRRWRWPVFFEWPAKRFAMAAAAVVAVFVFGVLAGRSIFFPTTEPGPTAPERGYQSVTSVAAYTETLEPLLIDFTNRRGRPQSDEMAELTTRVAVEMLVQTRLLKRAAEQSGDERLFFLLEDIELVLISIANLGGNNGDVAQQLDRVIENKEILFRLRQLPTEQSTI